MNCTSCGKFLMGWREGKGKPGYSRMFIATLLAASMMMGVNNLYGNALADPAHCDQAGYPSCYSVGYKDGQANPGTSCPSGHNYNYCVGWDAGARMENPQPTPQSQANTPTNATTETTVTNEHHHYNTPAACIAAGYDWDPTPGFCSTGKIYAIFGTTVCHDTSAGHTCEAGSVPGSGLIPVKYINHTAPDPGCTRLTAHPNYESCIVNQPIDNTTTMAFATNNTVVVPDPNHTKAWNAGYSQGYNAYNLTGTHTKAFFYGYFNGSNDFWYNRGYACGISGKTVAYNGTIQEYGFCGLFSGRSDAAEKQFRYGNNTGWKNRIDMLGSDSNDDRDHLSQIVLPVNTTDGYKQYFVGFANGMQAYQNNNSPHYIRDIFAAQCNNTVEYCTGLKAGWFEEDWNSD